MVDSHLRRRYGCRRNTSLGQMENRQEGRQTPNCRHSTETAQTTVTAVDNQENRSRRRPSMTALHSIPEPGRIDSFYAQSLHCPLLYSQYNRSLGQSALSITQDHRSRRRGSSKYKFNRHRLRPFSSCSSPLPYAFSSNPVSNHPWLPPTSSQSPHCSQSGRILSTGGLDPSL